MSKCCTCIRTFWFSYFVEVRFFTMLSMIFSFVHLYAVYNKGKFPCELDTETYSFCATKLVVKKKNQMTFLSLVLIWRGLNLLFCYSSAEQKVNPPAANI